MNAYKVEAIVTENGTVTLQGLPFRPGETVEVIILEQGSTTQQKNPSQDRAFAFSDQEYLLGVETQMTEWGSADDEAAYHDL